MPQAGEHSRMLFCPTFIAEREMVVEERAETYPVRGEPITITARVMVCTTCGTNAFEPETDSRNLVAAYEQYRLRHDLTSPEEIRAVREQYGLSVQELALLLGWRPATLARYEKGAPPSPAHDAVLKCLKDPAAFQRIVAPNLHRLPEPDRARLHQRLSERIKLSPGQAPS